MDGSLGGLTVWLTISGLFILITTLMGRRRLRGLRARKASSPEPERRSAVDVLIPVKGVGATQKRALPSFLEQTHPNYEVLFIVEDEDSDTDPGALIDSLCEAHSNARKVVSSTCLACAQKNHNLIAGARAVREEAEILVFCDSSNVADADWLARFTAPLEECDDIVVTTFRVFEPRPPTLGGVCQALYAAFVLSLMTFLPRPWGGATGIRRGLFDRLDVNEAWSKTVVDDLILGNLLDRAGVPIAVQADCLLRSPIENQTIAGFLGYLDRQILFPKFTNPGIWVVSLLLHLNLTAAVLTALLILPALYLGGVVGIAALYPAAVFVAIVVTALLIMRRTNSHAISTARWLAYSVPCIVLSAFIFVRSVFRDYVLWHGRRYRSGSGGVVREVIFEDR